MTANLPLLDGGNSKQELVRAIHDHLRENGFTITEIDATRPWGAFLRVANEQADKFVERYFGDLDLPESARRGERSPKILLVAPGQRLSWQHHERRSEFWRVVSGSVGVYLSTTDDHPNAVQVLRVGDTIELPRTIRHRLAGLDEWGAVAEIWIHLDPQNLSDEQDIHRLQDDYARV
jgi:mannose-6-phosphate isomerase-like protein (cupin superfamily)